MGAHMKKRILPVIIAILLILVIAGGALGKVLLDKYSYSKEEADWNEFYQVSESDRSAIILQDVMVERSVLCGYDGKPVVVRQSDRSDPYDFRRDFLYDNRRHTGCRICDQFRGRGYRLCGGGLCEAVHKLFL